jgi:ATP-dependent exoDNAse (exonuclease V) beta subunit
LRAARALQERSGDDDAIQKFLVQRGLDAVAARAAVGSARSLYERVVTARVPVTIETFHGWFWQLIARAPLGAGVPFAPTLLDSAERVRVDAWLHFTAMLVRDEHAEARAAWEWLVDEIGDFSARKLLMQFLHKRAEWWSFAAGDEEQHSRARWRRCARLAKIPSSVRAESSRRCDAGGTLALDQLPGVRLQGRSTRRNAGCNRRILDRTRLPGGVPWC